jgi:hypothetical protein
MKKSLKIEDIGKIWAAIIICFVKESKKYNMNICLKNIDLHNVTIVSLI